LHHAVLSEYEAGPCHRAAIRRIAEMKRLLLGAGVDESICNQDGKTALAVAKNIEKMVLDTHKRAPWLRIYCSERNRGHYEF